MQTALIEIKTTDGRTFRVNCENATQINKVWASIRNMNTLDEANVIQNGIHSAKQWLEIQPTLNK